uniref:Proteasome subunit alpha type-4-like n=1 Tax=Cacopsylla melanoneura TaxID=428564 RepID=A0A8D8TUE0_9HEMI
MPPYPPSYNAEGRVTQVCEAEDHVRESRTVLGLISENGVVLLCQREKPHSLNHVTPIGSNMIAAGTGFPGDILYLLNKCEVLVDKYRLNFEQDMPVDEFVQELADLISLNTILKTMRPYYASIIVAGWDTRGYHLYRVEPNGRITSWTAVAVGRLAPAVNEEFGMDLPKMRNLSLKTARKIGVDTYQKRVSQDLSSLEMVWLKSVDNKIEVVYTPPEEIQSIAQSRM